MGRERELAELHTALADALGGAGRLFLVSGEPGIGKTRLVEELAIQATALGHLDLWGRCWEGQGAPLYWPWVQVFRACLREAAFEDVIADLQSRAPEVERILTGAGEPASASREAAEAADTAGRFRFFDGVSGFLERIARVTPILLILDDLHGSDASSLSLLEFLARRLRKTRLLVVGTYREAEATQAGHVIELLSAVRRVASHLPLRGLEEAEVARILRETSGHEPSAALTRAVHERSDGNPFFVDELSRMLQTEERTEAPGSFRTGRSPLPLGVRATIGGRLRQLTAECREILAAASVIGREFDLATLREAIDLPVERISEGLFEAERRGVVLEMSSALGRFSFVHALVQETIYGDLGPNDRVRIHGRIGEALEREYRANPAPHLAELAHHFAEAAPAGRAAKAIAYARRAGAQAEALFAFEEAARHFGMAVRFLEREDATETAELSRMLAILGRSQRRSGDANAAMATCGRAAALARALHDPELLGEAAFEFDLARHEAGRGAEAAVELLDEALRVLGPGESPLRALLMGRLAIALLWRDGWGGPSERRKSLCSDAMDMARRVGQPYARTTVLWARLEALDDPENAGERLAVATELLEVSRRLDHEVLTFPGHYFRLWSFLSIGDLRAVDLELRHCERLIALVPEPVCVAHTVLSRAMRALHEGRLDESDRLAGEALELARQMRSRLLALPATDLLFVIRTEQGRLDEVESDLRSRAERHPEDSGVGIALAFLLAEAGRDAEARVELERLRARDFEGLARGDRGFFTAAARLADVCVLLDDAGLAARLYERLLPFAHLNLTLAAAISLGSAERVLGALATVTGRWEEASLHFEAALRSNERMGAIPWLAHTQADYARMLWKRGGAADRKRSLALLEGALQTADALGMTRLLSRVRLLEAAAAGHSDLRAGAAPHEKANVFRREGEYWTIVFGGHAFRLRDSKGLRHLAELLDRPGTEIHVLDLARSRGPALGPGRASAESEPSSRHLGDAGEVLDDQARSEYRRRLEALRAEIVGAEGPGEREHVSRLQEEIALLTRELAQGIGLGGRRRRAAAASERARLAVTGAIRAALKRVSEHSPSLGEHLALSIRTGTFCSYQPDPRAPITWAR